VNHIYVSVLAEFETKARKRNEVVVWDRILSSKRDARIKLQEARNKYLLKDLGYNLRYAHIAVLLGPALGQFEEFAVN